MQQRSAWAATVAGSDGRVAAANSDPTFDNYDGMMSFESTVRPAPQSSRRAPTPHPALVQDEGKSFHCTSRPVRSKCPSLTRAPDYKCPCDNDQHQPFGAGGELYPRYLNLQDGRVLLTFTVRLSARISERRR